MNGPRLGYRILGPVELIRDGRPVSLRAKQRALLALLLLDRNRVVPVDRIVNELWGGERAAKAANTVQVYVSQLRKQLDPAGASGAEILLTRPPGYLLLVEPDTVDVDRFERLLEQGRALLAGGDPAAAGRRLGEALAVWRGGALADLAYEEFAQFEILRLEELRLTALAERIEADLAVGKASELVGELEALVAQNPLRERFREQLMLALYRSGRQAAALEAYQDARRALVDELGIDPSPSLQRLEASILRQDETLDVGSSPGVEQASASAPAAPSRRREVRRVVSILCLRVSVDSAAGVDPEALHAVNERALEALGLVVESHGGIVERTFEDELRMVFGLPAAHEDDPVRAVKVALEAARTVADLAVAGVDVACHSGVATGAVLAVQDAETVAILAGAAAATARRFAQLAGPGELFLDETTRRAHPDARVESVADASTDQPVWHLIGLDAEPRTIRRLDTPLTGREDELAELRRAFDRCSREGRCRLFTILGPAGIGKSRLAHELRTAVQHEATVLVGRNPSYGQGITFWPLAEVVRQVTGDDVRARLSEFTAGDPDGERVQAGILGALGLEESVSSPAETFWAVRRFVESLARQQPLVLVFDDLHWAEPTFLDLVEHLADNARGPVLLVCLARQELLDRRPMWGGGKLDATTVLLRPLSNEQSRALIENLGRELDASVERRVVQAAEGNPLFLEQMLAMTAERDDATVVVPASVEALIAARLDLLPEQERITLEHASVVGREFWPAAVAELLGVDEAELTPVFELVTRKQLIEPALSPLARDQGYRFQHQLIREVAYGTLPQAVRADLHERLAEWLDRRLATHEGEYEELVGYHFEQAHAYGAATRQLDDRLVELAAQAARRLGEAGHRAYRRGDMPATVNLIRRALALERGAHERLPLLVELGDALRDTGDLAGADGTFADAISQAHELGDATLEGRARVRLLRLRIQTEPGVALADHLREAEAVVAALERAGDEHALADAWNVIAWIPWVRCQAQATEDALARALEYARRTGDARAETAALSLYLGTAVHGPRNVEQGIERCEELLARHGLERRLEALARRALAALLSMQGRFEEGRDLLQQDRLILEELGLTILRAAAAEIWAMLELAAGEPARAEVELREGMAMLAPLGERATQNELRGLLAEALCLQERYDETLALTEEVAAETQAEDASAQVRWRGPRAKALARKGRIRTARRLAEEALALADATDFLNLRANALTDLAEVCRLGRAEDDAVTALRAALALYETKGNLVAAARVEVLLASLGAVVVTAASEPGAARAARGADSGGPAAS